VPIGAVRRLFLSYTRRRVGYAAEVLEESLSYAAHADRTSVALEDVKLAIAAKLETQFLRPTGTEELTAYAKAVNRLEFPRLTHRPGIHVAQEENLLSPNYQFFPRRRREKRLAGRGDEGDEGDEGDADAGKTRDPESKTLNPSVRHAVAEPTAMAPHDPVTIALRGGKRNA
jgi:hypothetical protein